MNDKKWLLGRLIAMGFAAVFSHAALAAEYCPNLLLQVKDLTWGYDWIDSKFTSRYIEQLRPVSMEDVQNVHRFDPQTVLEAASLFQHQAPGREPLDIQFELVEIITPLWDRRLVVPFLMRSGGKPVGFSSFTLYKTKGVGKAFNDFTKVDVPSPEVRGVSESYQTFVEKFFPAVEVEALRAEMGWSGRYVWAKRGFEFDPDAYLWENGKRLPQLEVIRNNFGRFLVHHGLMMADLVIKTEDQSVPIQTLEDLKTPADFMNVHHRDGLTLEVRPYVDVDKLGAVIQAPPGKAFGLWDYRPRPGQPVSIEQERKPLSDIAFPTWMGIRRFSR